REIFRYPTIKKLAEHINTLQQSVYTSIGRLEGRDCYPVSSAQRRLLILDQFEGIGLAYNMPGVVIVEGNLNRMRLEFALQQLLDRHEVLRTSFQLVNGEMMQQIHEHVEIHLEELAFSQGEPMGEKVEQIVRCFVRRFDLSIAPLFRVGL